MRTVTQISIAIATIYVFIFAIAGHAGMDLSWYLLMFSLSPFPLLWMIYAILKFEEEPDGKWEEGDWYEDYDKDACSYK